MTLLSTTPGTISKQLLEQISPQPAWVPFSCLPPHKEESGREEEIIVQNTRLLWGMTFASHFFEGTALILSLEEHIGGTGSHPKTFLPQPNMCCEQVMWCSTEQSTLIFKSGRTEFKFLYCHFLPYNHGQATNVLCTSVSSSLKWVMVLLTALWGLNKTYV